MSEISKADVLRIDAKLQARKTNKIKQDAKANFEEQLLQTVKKLENMGSEIKAMMESNQVQLSSAPKATAKLNKTAAQRLENPMEKITSVGKTAVKTAKNVTAQYEAMNTKNTSDSKS